MLPPAFIFLVRVAEELRKDSAGGFWISNYKLVFGGGNSMELNETGEVVAGITAAERAEEQKLLRRLQMMMNMTMQVIAQDGSLTIDEAAQMIGDSRKAALAMFPGKELAYDLIWKPRFQRLMRERFRIM